MRHGSASSQAHDPCQAKSRTSPNIVVAPEAVAQITWLAAEGCPAERIARGLRMTQREVRLVLRTASGHGQGRVVS